MSRTTAAGPDAAHRHLWADLPFQPVFILGDHRSGTTLLYQLLQATGHFNVVTAYHIIHFDELIHNRQTGREQAARIGLNAWFQQQGLSNRGIDAVALQANLPEEYGFVLESSLRPRLTAQTMPKLLALARKVQYLGEPDKPLLLKNPWDFANFSFINTAFPDSRFIFIHRHPQQVLSSQIRAVQDLYRQRNSYLARLSPAYARVWRRPVQRWFVRGLYETPLALRASLRHVFRVTQTYLTHSPTLPPTACTRLRFEDLCRAPAETVNAILAFLHLPPVAADTLIPIHATQRPVLPLVARHQALIADRLAAYLQHCGYDATPPPC